ncbi:outer membrane lipoprotein carrier protein LolA [Altererythrobacter salegens]|uniref:Outer membrane lipoprotein carrier protein LolA n=1 Tax=Croceibacterium salegens TaxID=1737568 RepID=A0A6I4SXF5_9SPHN|nr:outer membrane lipoprotein carrier protein LolA [Croceibacterium salegens]MXO60774.1 outer membrane lipoprotein carrier protein LolA [Croceibacterium salegens]
MTHLTYFTRKPLHAAIAGVLAVALPATALLAPAMPAVAADDSTQLDQVVAALRGISTLKADFTQTDRSGRTLRGELTLKNPGKIRFEYAKGTNMLVVSDGSSLTFVDYEVNQVQRYPIKNSPLGALLDPSRDVKKYGKLIPTGNPNVFSVEVKDPKKPEYGIFTAIMIKNAAAPGGLELANWVQIDAQNQRTVVRLTNQKYGVAVPDSAFKFRDPRRSSRRPG